MATVHAAGWLAWECGYAASEHTQAPTLAPEVVEWLAFSEEDWEAAKEELAKQFQACEDLLRIARNGG